MMAERTANPEPTQKGPDVFRSPSGKRAMREGKAHVPACSGDEVSRGGKSAEGGESSRKLQSCPRRRRYRMLDRG